MAANKHNCPSCGEAFPSSQEVAAHWVTNHDRGYVPRGQRIKRSWYCWRCASEVPAHQDTCVCGWQRRVLVTIAPVSTGTNTNTEGNK